ncbi:MAG: response regulator [Planctomycetota bacterium]|nr:response regulator [Planctomycetota bacterium]
MDEPFTDRLRLNAEQRRRLLSELDRGLRQEPQDCRRRHARWEYRALDIAVRLTHPGGGQSRLLVCSRNLSAGGIAFLHGGYLHPGSECTLVMIRRDGTRQKLTGTIRHCRFLRGTCHEAGIKFDHPIDPHEFLLPSSLESTERGDKLGPSIQIPSLNGCVLLADDSETDRRLVAHQLSATGLVVVPAATSGSALDALQQTDFDAVLCGLDLDAGGGLYAVMRIRDSGYGGPILVFTAEISEEALLRVREAGADEVLGKPYDAGYVMYLLSECLHQPTPSEPLVSRLESEPGMAELLIEYIDEAQRLSHRLSKAVDEEDFPAARELCLRLAGSGANHGFDQVSVAARDALRALDAAGDVTACLAPVRRVLSICARMSCTASLLPSRSALAAGGKKTPSPSSGSGSRRPTRRPGRGG